MQVELGESMIDLWSVGVVMLAGLLVVAWQRKRHFGYVIGCAIFGLYVLVLVDVALFPIPLSGAYAEMLREERTWSGFINLIPLNFNLSEMPHLVYQQIFQNILLTVPFGLGIYFVAPARAKTLMWLGAGVELGQVVISLVLGYPYRVLDVNDVLLNALGVVIGYGLFRGLGWLMERVAIATPLPKSLAP